MHPDLEKLIVLQAHDVEAKRLRDEMVALPKHVAALETKAKATEGQRAVIVDLIAKEETLRRRQESDVKDFQAKIARLRKNMDMATTTVQVTAFEHEIAFAQGEIARLEDSEIESMERSEGLESQKKLADEAVADATATLERERARAAETVAQDKTLLAAVEEKRKAVRAEICESCTFDLRPHREGQRDSGCGGVESEVHGVPDDGAAAALERSARSRQRGDDDDLRELRTAALLRSGARLSAA